MFLKIFMTNLCINRTYSISLIFHFITFPKQCVLVVSNTSDYFFFIRKKYCHFTGFAYFAFTYDVLDSYDVFRDKNCPFKNFEG